MLKAGLVVRMEGGGLRSCYAGTLRSRIEELRIEAMPSQMNITERGIVNAVTQKISASSSRCAGWPR